MVGIGFFDYLVGCLIWVFYFFGIVKKFFGIFLWLFGNVD